MSDEGPAAGEVLLGCFLIVVGICLMFVGGGCTLLLLGSLGSPDPSVFGFLLLSLLILAGGVAVIYAATRLFRGD